MSLFAGKAEHFERGRFGHDVRVRILLAELFDTSGTVLELGAGTGNGTVILEGVFRSIIAVEPDKGMLAILRHKIDRHKVECVSAAVEDLDPQSLSFDYLISFQAAHWFFDTPQYVALSAKARKPVLDIATHVWPADEKTKMLLDHINNEFRRPDAVMPREYPSKTLAKWHRRNSISLENLIHGICSCSWIDHNRYSQIKDLLASQIGQSTVEMQITTEANEVLLTPNQ